MMKIYYSNKFPPKGFKAINIIGVIIGRRDAGILSKYDINHERIHSYQMRELLWIFFYLIYSIEWFVGLIKYRNSLKAYYNISFEREAYQNEDNLSYLDKRKIFSFIKYYKNKTN